jgi:hypothetical protein
MCCRMFGPKTDVTVSCKRKERERSRREETSDERRGERKREY